MPRHVCDSRVKDLCSKRGKAVVTSSKKLKKKDKRNKKKKIQCDYCEMKIFDVDHFLDIIRVWDGVMHLHVFLDVVFEDANERARYRGRMADVNHFSCCDYRIHKGCMIHKWLMAHQQYCDKEVHFKCNSGKLRWVRKREKTVEKKFVELYILKHYFYPWIDVDLVVSCYHYDFKELVRARESADFSLTNILTVLKSTRLVQEKQINMQCQLLLEKLDCWAKFGRLKK